MPKLVKNTKFKAALSTFGEGRWVYIPVTREQAAKFDFPNPRFKRVLCSINGHEAYHAALMSDGAGDFIISVNKPKREEWGIKVGDTVSVRLEIDTSKYGRPMPDEFRAVLDEDPEGDRLFHELSPGMQRSMLYQVEQKDDVDLRIHRALAIVEHMKENGGKIDFKALNQKMKRPKLKQFIEDDEDNYRW